ncbi:MAG: ATP-binding protein [Myxococcales bacterium]|nr:hypothetical protein [Myxococcales bacterium]
MSAELDQVRAQAAALEQMLEIYELTVSEQSQKLERQAEELRRSNEALEQYAYVISHDLQEPLRMVAAYSELIAERYRGKLDETADKYIAFAVGGARRMQELINALLDYSRISTRGKDFARVSLDEVAADAVQNLSVAIREAQAEVVREPLGAVIGDRIQLTQLLQNLIANALKFRSENVPPRIRIAGALEGDGFHLRVSDNGIGIEERYHKRIFVVFQRLNPKKYPGTGIGLSICQRIAERHGGSIRVESEPGKGSTFHVVLGAGRAAESA